MRLVLKRAARARTLLIAATITATLTTVLLTAFLQFAQLLPAAGAEQAVAAAPALDRSVFVTGSAGSGRADLAKRDAEVGSLFADGLGGAPVEVFSAGYAIGQRLPDGFGDTVAGTDGTYAVVTFLTGLPGHARLTEGGWPTKQPPGQPAQVALPASVAATLAVRTGDRIPIDDTRTKQPSPVVVSGLFTPVDPTDPYWLLASAPVTNGGYGPLVVDREEFLTRYALLSTVDWVAVPDLSDVSGVRLNTIGAAAARIRDGRPTTLGIDPGLRIRTDVDGLAGRLATADLVTRSGLLLPALLLLLIAGYSLWLVARLLAEQRRGENSLLRARGAARRQLARYAGAEALLVVLPAALLGAPLAASLLRRVDAWVAVRGLDLSTVDQPVAGGPVGWTVALVTALGCAGALVLPAARQGRTWVAEQQERSRPGRWAVAQRAGVDLALVVVAVLAWTQLHQYGGPVTAGGAALGIDPLLVTAPAIGVLAATAVSLRLLPLATRGGVRVAERRRSFTGLLGVWQADRRPHAGPVLLLVLAVAIAALATCVASTWRQSQRDQGAHLAGADLRVTPVSEGVPPATAALADLPGVTSVMRADRGATRPAPELPATLLAVDSPTAADVMVLRDDLVGGDATELYERLTQARRTATGAPLPARAHRLTGEILFTIGGPDAEWIQTGSLALTVDDGSGVLHPIPLGEPTPGEPLRFDVELPVAGPNPPALVGFDGAASSRFLPFGRVMPEQIIASTTWTLSGVTAVDTDGQPTPVTLPADWTIQTDAGGSGSPVGLAERDAQPTRVTITYPVDYRPYADSNAWQFRYADLEGLATPPAALVTPNLLAATRTAVGETMRVAGSTGTPDLDVTVVGVIGAIPASDEPAGILVDLPTLASYRFAARQALVTPGEWWLATDPARHEDAVAALAGHREWTVVDREQVVGRLLDDPLGAGVLLALYAAALAATVLAGFGLAVDARATALRRAGELAVLHTLGTAPTALARAFVVEQGLLAGLGVLSGLSVGVAVAAAMAPALVLTAAAQAPNPPALLIIPAVEVGVPAVALFGVALVLGAAVARRARREVAAGLLRIGAE